MRKYFTTLVLVTKIHYIAFRGLWSCFNRGDCIQIGFSLLDASGVHIYDDGRTSLTGIRPLTQRMDPKIRTR